MSSYRIQIFNSKEVLRKDSGIQYTAKDQNTNGFYWLCDLTNEPYNETYSVTLTFTTTNQYTFSDTYNFILIEPSNLEFNPIFNFNKRELPHNGLGYAWKRYDDPTLANYTALELQQMNSETREDGRWYEDENEKVLVTCEDGWVEITISNKSLTSPGYLFLKRASSLDNFQEWELLHCFYIEDGNSFECTTVDKTVSSLVRYKYSVQYLTAKGSWTRTVISAEIVYPDFHDILLSRGDKQLAIRYNGQIASMTPTVNRVKVDTLGGRYPRFAENAKLHYKQFQLSGLIIAESDYNRKFLNDLDYASQMKDYDDNIEGASYQVRNDTIQETGLIDVEYIDDKGETQTLTYSNGTYSTDILQSDTKIRQQKRDSQVNTLHDLYPRENWWWEREFREQAIEWLNDGEPKLYRSMTEGNLIVMIDGITLTPNAQLGRRIWNFSCTVYEVGDGNSLQELDSLGIYDVPNPYENTYTGIGDPVNIDTTITRKQLGQTYHVTAGESGMVYLVSDAPFGEASQVSSGDRYIIKYNSAGEAVKIPILSIQDTINDLYQGLYENYTTLNTEKKLNFKLSEVKIQFESLPQWYNLDTYAPQESEPNVVRMTLSKEGSTASTVNVLIQDTENGLEIVKATDKFSQKPWDTDSFNTSDDPITAFINDWETKTSYDSHGQQQIPGNNIVKIQMDSGEYSIDTGDIGDVVSVCKYHLNNAVNQQQLNNYGLGYKLELGIVSPHDTSQIMRRTIFVNERGYYQVPSNMIVKEIGIADGASATVDYILEYDLRYDDISEPNSYEIAEKIVGQISGAWDWNTSIGPIIQRKYWAFDRGRDHDSKESTSIVTQQMVDYWTAVEFDGTPYTILNIQSTADTGAQEYIVGRSGVLSLQTDYPTASMYVNGKRMVEAPKIRQDYLDEWEYVIDDSVYTNLASDTEQGGQFWWLVYNPNVTGEEWQDWNQSDIAVIVQLSEPWDETTALSALEDWYTLGESTLFSKSEILEPKPNTIYGIINSEGYTEYKIYYLDQGWFNVSFPNAKQNDYSIAYARVPVYGMINYRASILKKLWDNYPSLNTR